MKNIGTLRAPKYLYASTCHSSVPKIFLRPSPDLARTFFGQSYAHHQFSIFSSPLLLRAIPKGGLSQSRTLRTNTFLHFSGSEDPRKLRHLAFRQVFHPRYFDIHSRHRQSSTWWAAVVLFVALVGSALVPILVPKHKDRPIKEALETSTVPEDHPIPETDFPGVESNMAAEVLPGRVGTLTPEQEEKLREFWIAALQVFGVLTGPNAGEVHENGNGNGSPGTASKKPKKKRLGLFRGKNRDDDSASVASTGSNSHSANATPGSDDKYGQTKEFNEALATQTPESLRATFWSMVKHDHPDALLLRFLRARKWDVEKALVMMVSTMKWRATEVHVDDDIIKNGELAALEDANSSDIAAEKLSEDFLTQMRLGKSFLHGRDRAGRPLCFVRVRLHRQGKQSEESLERYTVFIIESARMLLAPPVDTAGIVFDMTGFSMANMDYAPVKFMIKCFEANYPESLGVVLVHKAPWVFQGIWKIIKGWLDPVVAAKVHFTNNVEELDEYIDPAQISKELGGKEDWTYQYVEPVPGENDIMKNTEKRDQLLVEREKIVKEFEKLTMDWINGNQTDVSSTKTRRHELARSLKDDYWRLDPYLRARSYYDRVGLITSEGGVMKAAAEKSEDSNGSHQVQTSADDID